MFDATRRFSSRLVDAVDLMIDFATLGEYGLEPAAEPTGSDCQRRSRQNGSGARFAAVDRGDHLPARL